MMYTVYVLISLRNGKRYVGYTAKPVSERLNEHNTGSTAWTRQNGPFRLLHAEGFDNKSECTKREKFLKTGQGRKYLDSVSC